jgi:hypothetical protein
MLPVKFVIAEHKITQDGRGQPRRPQDGDVALGWVGVPHDKYEYQDRDQYGSNPKPSLLISGDFEAVFLWLWGWAILFGHVQDYPANRCSATAR